ncbi:D(2) dopamine receptor-like [Lytechinus pictus]|uniref:D(2) dopamine receptor-like n=1 Tax=Lytechinus pictus TaxID=7653 RepID=UPI0030B9C633
MPPGTRLLVMLVVVLLKVTEFLRVGAHPNETSQNNSTSLDLGQHTPLSSDLDPFNQTDTSSKGSEYLPTTSDATQLVTNEGWEWWTYEMTTDPTKGMLTKSQGVWNEDSAGSMEFSWYQINWSWVIILQLISTVVGIVGNFLVIIVLFKRRQRSRSTDTLITGLACADFLTSVFLVPIPMPAYIPKNWIGEIYCRVIITQSLLWASIMASTYLLMSISVERYIAVVYPLHFKRLITRRRVSIFIVIIWFLSILSGLFAFIVYGVDAETNQCAEQYTFDNAQTIIAYYWFCLRLALPCFTMLVTQVLIARNLSQQFRIFKDVNNATKMTNGSQAPSFHIVARNRVLKLMLIVIVIYIVCWTPNQIAFLGYNLGWVPESYLNSTLHRFLTLLGFYNSCANPVIYTARYPEFRNALKDIFTCTSDKNDPLFEKMSKSTANTNSDLEV